VKKPKLQAGDLLLWESAYVSRSGDVCWYRITAMMISETHSLEVYIVDNKICVGYFDVSDDFLKHLRHSKNIRSFRHCQSS
jgi:hypothetical protein